MGILGERGERSYNGSLRAKSPEGSGADSLVRGRGKAAMKINVFGV